MSVGLNWKPIPEWRSSPILRSFELHFFKNVFFRIPSPRCSSIGLYSQLARYTLSGKYRAFDVRRLIISRYFTCTPACVECACYTVGAVRVSALAGGAPRLRNYPKSSNPMWTKVHLRQGAKVFVVPSETQRGAFALAVPFSAATRTILKPFSRFVSYVTR